MSRVTRAYDGLPTLAQSLLVSAEGLRVRRERTWNRQFRELLTRAELRLSWTQAEVEIWRDARLAKYVSDICQVPFYSRRFGAAGVTPADISSLRDLQALPILTKWEIKEAILNGELPQLRGPGTRLAHTSGTTGSGFRFRTSLAAIREQWAIWWRFRRQHSLSVETRCGFFGGRSIVPAGNAQGPFWRHDYSSNRVLFSMVHLSERTARDYVLAIIKQRVEWLHGYPSSISLLANYMIEQGLSTEGVVRAVTTGAESLLGQQVEVIYRAFGVRPVQHYGLAEAVANASECSWGALHVDEDFAAVEFVPQPDRGGYSLVGTNLSNLVTPMLRYETGDLVSGIGICECGRPGRVIDAIDGRQEDYIVLSSGAKVGRLDHIFKDLVNIREVQIQQTVPGQMVLSIVPGVKYSSRDEHSMLEEVRHRLGSDMTVRVRYVDAIPKEASGKLRLVVGPEAKRTDASSGPACPRPR